MTDVGLPLVVMTHASPPSVHARLEQQCRVVTINKDENIVPRQKFLEAIKGAHALFLNPYSRVDAEVLDTAGPQLKVIATCSVGLEHIDLKECERRGVKVGYTPNVLDKAVAELAVALTLATARRLEEAFQSVRDGVWGTLWENCLWMCGKQVSGSVVGIVGLGRIGFETAKRLAAFEPSKILYCGNTPKAYADTIRADFVSFHELLETSDFVVATCSINDSTRGLFDKEAFKRMKADAIFINVSRGALVNQDDLYEALSSNQIGAAGLDVTTPEPLPPNHRLLKLRNCVVSPHLGSATVRTRAAMCDVCVENIFAGLNGKDLPSPVPSAFK
ncbi:unnamed protein product [Lymnaea stagnalis]|uniref:Glyoxylate reductase/hydroxypyruvate reductase n=1 Tax=Lymnaea stagnalis TaxID=6523 RepID=A0AAV2IKA0_LYMST